MQYRALAGRPRAKSVTGHSPNINKTKPMGIQIDHEVHDGAVLKQFSPWPVGVGGGMQPGLTRGRHVTRFFGQACSCGLRNVSIGAQILTPLSDRCIARCGRGAPASSSGSASPLCRERFSYNGGDSINTMPRQLHACAQQNRTCLSHRRRSAFRALGSARRRGGHSCTFN